jgi:hypothetical protein
MKKATVVAISLFFIITAAGAVFGAMGLYVNGGVSIYDPTIGLNAEYQYDNFSVILGAGALAYNNFGYGAGLKFYLFGIDGGPFLGASYGTTGARANTHNDTSGNVIVDSSEVFQGFSAVAGWRLFFAEGWNLNLGSGISIADNRAMWTFDMTAGFMVYGDEEAKKNAEKYKKVNIGGEEEKMEEQSQVMTEPDENTVETEPPAEAKADTQEAKKAPAPKAAAKAAGAKQAVTPEPAGNTKNAK